MLTRQQLADKLKALTANYRSSDFDAFVMASDLDEFLKTPSNDPDIELALRFWESWADEAEHGFPGFYFDLKDQDWPQLADVLVSHLEKGGAVSDARLLDFRGRLKKDRSPVVQRIVTVIGHVVAIVCSVQIASVPVVLLNVYTSFLFPAWSLYFVWGASYLVTVMLTIRLSRVRFGVILILLITVFAFAISESFVSTVNQKYQKLNPPRNHP